MMIRIVYVFFALAHTQALDSTGGGFGPSICTEAWYTGAPHRSTAQRSGPTSPEGTITPRRAPLSHTVRLHTQPSAEQAIDDG